MSSDKFVMVPAHGEWLVRHGRVVEIVEVDADPNPEGWTYTCWSGPEEDG
jgi:hypothetical protein